jgi:hypothetical protein
VPEGIGRENPIKAPESVKDNTNMAKKAAKKATKAAKPSPKKKAAKKTSKK